MQIFRASIGNEILQCTRLLRWLTFILRKNKIETFSFAFSLLHRDDNNVRSESWNDTERWSELSWWIPQLQSRAEEQTVRLRVLQRELLSVMSIDCKRFLPISEFPDSIDLVCCNSTYHWEISCNILRDVRSQIVEMFDSICWINQLIYVRKSVERVARTL